MPEAPGQLTKSICLQCGLCCNGVLFADVKLRPADSPAALAGLGLRRRGATRSFSQPCQALQPDGCCRIYDGRPGMCREFECGVLRDRQAGRLTDARALRLIRQAQKQARKVVRLLERSGNHQHQLPLTKRYQAVMRQPIDLAADAEAGDRRGELMLAVNDLMYFLQRRFRVVEGDTTTH